MYRDARETQETPEEARARQKKPGDDAPGKARRGQENAADVRRRHEAPGDAPDEAMGRPSEARGATRRHETPGEAR